MDGALRAGHELLQAVADPGFRCFYIWLPALAADNEAAASYNEAALKARGARHYWDPDARLGTHLGDALGLELAWDTYLLYPRGQASIEHPAFWMHQLDTDLAPRLDVDVLRGHIQTLLSG